MSRTRRRFLGTLALSSGGSLARPAGGPTSAPLDADVAEMLMLGFTGSTAASPSARTLAGHIAAGLVGGVFFVLDNVGTRDDVRTLDTSNNVTFDAVVMGALLFALPAHWI